MMIPQTVRVITLTNKQTQTDRQTLLKTYTYHLLRYAIAAYVAGNDNVAVASDASRTSSTDSNLLTDSENFVRDRGLNVGVVQNYRIRSAIKILL